jgi:hypothetical protein
MLTYLYEHRLGGGEELGGREQTFKHAGELGLHAVPRRPVLQLTQIGADTHAQLPAVILGPGVYNTRRVLPWQLNPDSTYCPITASTRHEQCYHGNSTQTPRTDQSRRPQHQPCQRYSISNPIIKIYKCIFVKS